jgi:hypothetical protein
VWPRGAHPRHGAHAGPELDQSLFGDPGRRGRGAERPHGHRSRALPRVSGAARFSGAASQCDFRSALRRDADVIAYLLENGVAIPNGASYGMSPYFRVSFASALANLEEASKRIAAAAQRLA